MSGRRIFSPQRARFERENSRHAQVYWRAQIVPAMESIQWSNCALDRVRANRLRYRAVLTNEN